ncbi:MAG: 50S ribosomal protein P1 [archaeon]|nr:MAG: 50S ribosomal protein P1 [archaeon]
MEYIYGALLLHKLGKEVNEENLKKVVEATGAQVDETKVKSVIASLKDVDIDKVLSEAATMPAPSGGAASKGEKKEDTAPKEKEKSAEEAAEGLAALFG